MSTDAIRLQPVPGSNAEISDGFWAPRVAANAAATMAAEYRQCKDTGRIDAFRLDWKPGQPNKPHRFWDSDVAKWLEAAACTLEKRPDPELEGRVDETVELVAAAQQPDGYLNVFYTVVEPENRWKNLRDWHELYCAGHLMEAAVALYERLGKRKLLDVMARCADYIGEVFGPGAGQKPGYPGHEEIELALVKMYRATGRKRYLELAEFFVDQRGQLPYYFDLEAIERGELPEMTRAELIARAPRYDYNQSHLPVREQTAAEGHAVRACYLYAGMADVARETGDAALAEACRRIWRNITTRRMYVTGGVGSRHAGERFSIDYDLPNEEAYAETCAAIALVFFAHRMLHLELNGAYADVMERALYNGVLSGISLDGTRFFYVNPLSQTPAERRYRNWVTQRPEWFGCACCPPNIARLLASLGDYVYSASDDSLAVHLYAAGRVSIDVGGTNVVLTQETRYPWNGAVKLTVTPAEPTDLRLLLRLPGWCREPVVSLNGAVIHAPVLDGYACMRRTWSAGDTVELTLPMPVERIEAHPAVRHDCGRIALQRGPLVYCLEEVDNGANLHDIVLPDAAEVVAHEQPDLLGGTVVLEAEGRRRALEEWAEKLYSTEASARVAARLRAVPYYAWANRGEGEMIVWIQRQS